MKFVIISGNPKKEGLTHNMTMQIFHGAEAGGAEVEIVNVCGMTYCRSCNGGAGKCITEHRCIFGSDGFSAAQDKIRSADALAFISPVYWEEVSEGLKSFLDRLRRCESSTFFAPRSDAALAGKSLLIAACAGGSGMDMLTPLRQLERFAHHTGSVVFDAIGINRWNQSYKGEALYMAAKLIAEGVKPGDTVRKHE